MATDVTTIPTAEEASLPVVTGVSARVGQQELLIVYALPNRDVKSLPFSWSPLNSLSMAVGLLLTSDVFKYSRTCLLIIIETLTTSSLWEISRVAWRDSSVVSVLDLGSEGPRFGSVGRRWSRI